MLKRIIALSLCLLMILPVFIGCAKEEKDENDKGAYIKMYLTDPVYNFDPAMAYRNESSAKIVGLMFDTLFVLDDNGKIKNSLAKDYEIFEDAKVGENGEYKMIITLNDTCWSDGNAVSANDVVFAWKRLLNVSNSFDSAALLYDIKNAREAKEGEASIDDVRIFALNETQVEIEFVGKIDYDKFLLNLTSLALAPLREDVINQTVDPTDWAKKTSIFLASGPFRLRELSYEEGSAGLILERNTYYYRDTKEDTLDEYVTPFRLIVDFKSAEEIKSAYDKGEIFYVGDIPLSIRNDVAEDANITDALSTHTYVLNENAVVRYYNKTLFKNLSSNECVYDPTLVAGEDGDKIFADANVRNALSLAINREDIAKAVVYAKAATALVPYGVFNKDSDKDLFREVGKDILATGAKMDEAKALLSTAKVDPSKYMFAISVASYDEVHMEIAKMVQAAWTELGFNVAINAIDVVKNKDKDKTTDAEIDGVMDDIFAESYQDGLFEVAAIDYTAFTADAFSVLAPFAKNFTGGAATKAGSTEFSIPAHISGYNSAEYNDLIEKASKENNLAARADLLHQAEAVLMKDLPVIPIIFNQNATLISKELSKYDFTYYGTPVFNKLNLKNYLDYVPEEEK